MAVEDRLSKQQLCTLGARIINRLTTNPSDGYQPYGWDWPTLRVIHPRQCRMFQQLRLAYQDKLEGATYG